MNQDTCSPKRSQPSNIAHRKEEYSLDESAGAAGDDEVDEGGEGEELGDGFAAEEEGDGIGGEGGAAVGFGLGDAVADEIDESVGLVPTELGSG